MGVKGIDRCGCLIQSRRHWICGRKTIDKQRTGNGEFDLLNVVKDQVSSNEIDQAIIDLLEGTGVTSSVGSEMALAA